VAAVTKLMPKTYVGVAALMVNSAANDPLAGAQVATAAGMLSNYVATQMELLQSSEVLTGVIDKLNLTADPEFASGNRGGDDTLREWVEAKLRKNLEIEQGRGGSQLIYISASAANPVQAADIANAVADAFTDQQDQRTNGPASERAKRYTGELADLKRKVTQAQDAATQFRNRSGTIDLDTKVDVEMDALTNLERRLQEVRNGLVTNRAKTAGSQDVSAPVMASQTVRTLREEDARLRSRMAQLRISLGPNHPQVVELKSQIDANSASLAAALASFSRATSSEIAVSSSEVAALERAVNEQRQKVLDSRRSRDEGAKYQLEMESAQAAYKRALDGYDQIMFVHSTNINVASRARPPIRAEKPNAIKNMAMGAALGLLLALVLPFLYELLNRRVRCRDDVERDFGIPVLVEFPPLGHSPRMAA
jgi:uncharacterized protein involved in exopolysaccharide biosynthesis